MSTDRLPSGGTRTTTLDQVGQPTGNSTGEREQERQVTPPALRQRRTGREDLEDEKDEDQPREVALLNQHSKPELIARNSANQASFQLDPEDQEKFVYTKKQFMEAVEKEDVRALVKMLRHGKDVGPDKLTDGDFLQITRNLIDTNKPKILSDLIPEKEIFWRFFLIFFEDIKSIDQFKNFLNFSKTMDEHRALPKDLKIDLFSQGLLTATKNGCPDMLGAMLQLESSLVVEGVKGDCGYLSALKFSLKNRNDLHQLLLKNMVADTSQVKVGMSAETFSFAAGLASATGHLEWAIVLQDEKLKMEKADGKDHPDFSHSLGHKINAGNEEFFTTDLITFCLELQRNSAWAIQNSVEDIINLYKKKSDGSKSDDFYFLSNVLIMECIRPRVAEAISDTYLNCMDAITVEETSSASEDSSQDGDDSSSANTKGIVSGHFIKLGSFDYSRDSDEDDTQKSQEAEVRRLQALFASQLGSLYVDDDGVDLVTALQVSTLSQAGQDFIDNLLRDVPKLINDCFNLMNSKFILDAQVLEKFLIDDFAFPESLARFLAESMSELVKQWASKPGMVLPRPMSALEISEYVRQTVKENACREFKNNFSELIKSKDLITRFNKDAEGREDVWPNYFYAYLDRMKAALPAAKTAQ